MIPLSFAHQQFSPNNKHHHGAYTDTNIAIALSLEDHLYYNTLRRALLTTVQCHKSLRTSFSLINNTLHSCSHNTVTREGSKRSPVTTTINAIIKEYANNNFTIDSPALCKTYPLSHLLVCYIASIAADHTPASLLASNLGVLCKAYINYEAASLSDSDHQYQDIYRWHNWWLKPKNRHEQFYYWCKQLAGRDTKSSFPIGYPLRMVSNRKTKAFPFFMPEKRFGKYGEYVRSKIAPIDSIVLADLHVLLSRYRKQRDICTGFPITCQCCAVFGNIFDDINITPLLLCQVNSSTNCNLFVQQVTNKYARNGQHGDRLTETMTSNQTLALGSNVVKKTHCGTNIDRIKPQHYCQTSSSRVKQAACSVTASHTNTSAPVSSIQCKNKRLIAQHSAHLARHHSHSRPIFDVRLLCSVLQEVLRINEFGASDDFFAYGGDSILLVKLISRLRSIGIPISANTFIQQPTVEGILRHTSNIINLQPVQLQCLSCRRPPNYPFTDYYVITLNETFSCDAIHNITEALYLHHHVLHWRFQMLDQQWQACELPFQSNWVEQSLAFIKLPAHSCGSPALFEHQHTKALAELDLEHGPLFKLSYFYTKEAACTQSYLLLTTHPMAIDPHSCRLLLEDINSEVQRQRLAKGRTVTADTDDNRIHNGGAIEPANNTQLKVNTELHASDPFAQERCATKHYYNDQVSSIRFVINPPASDKSCPPPYYVHHAHSVELILAALATTQQRSSGNCTIRVKVLFATPLHPAFNNGNNQSVGMLTPSTLLDLAWSANTDLTSLIKTIKAQWHAAAYRHAATDHEHKPTRLQTPTTSQADADPQIIISELGEFDSPLENMCGNVALLTTHKSPRNRQIQTKSSIYITVYRIQGLLHVSVNFLTMRHQQKEMESFCSLLQQAIDSIGNHMEHHRAACQIPSDFPLAHSNTHTLSQWLQRYSSIEDIYPATGTQMGLLFHGLHKSNARRGNGTNDRSVHHRYLTQIHLAFRGPIDTARLKRAWQHVCNRYSAMRTAFVGFGLQQAQQLIVKRLTLAWREYDWQEMSDNELNTALERVKHSDLHTAFEPDQPGLTRFSVFKASCQQAHLLWTHHHCILDGWSIAIILKDVQHYYQYPDQCKPFTAPPKMPYCNYIRWLDKQDMEKARIFWRTELFGARSTLLVCNCMPNTSEKIHTIPQQQKLALSQKTIEQLQGLARCHHVTINTIIQASWAYLLYCHSGNNDTVFGQICSGRGIDLPGVEDIVGLLINTLPVRVALKPYDTIAGWLKKIHRADRQREQFSYLPLADIQHCYDSRSCEPLFNSLLAFQLPIEQIKLSDTEDDYECTQTKIQCHNHSHYDLTLAVTTQPSMVIDIKYRSSMWSPRSITQLLQQLDQILHALIDPAVQRVCDLPKLKSSYISIATETTNSNASPKLEKALHCNNEDMLSITVLEKRIQSIWLELLDLNKRTVGIDDDFFKLGAHSIHAIQLASRLSNNYSITISVDEVFEHPTIHAMAKHIHRLTTASKLFNEDFHHDQEVQETGTL